MYLCIMYMYIYIYIIRAHAHSTREASSDIIWHVYIIYFSFISQFRLKCLLTKVACSRRGFPASLTGFVVASTCRCNQWRIDHALDFPRSHLLVLLSTHPMMIKQHHQPMQQRHHPKQHHQPKQQHPQMKQTQPQDEHAAPCPGQGAGPGPFIIYIYIYKG